MTRAYYSDSIASFRRASPDDILGKIVRCSEFAVEIEQKDAWLEQISILRELLNNYEGSIYFEYSIPRMGRRIDVVLLIGAVIFVFEFKVGEKQFLLYAEDQVWDYALDLKNFHETSHGHFIAPVLIATQSKRVSLSVALTPQNDRVFFPMKANIELLPDVIRQVLALSEGQAVDSCSWEKGRYSPTPTIIEAAMALYAGHSVEDISRSDAGAINLSQTSNALSEIIKGARERSEKSICFLTGVPGAGKTLVGLNIANTHNDKSSSLYSVFLSGNGPLVKILCEALARNKISRAKERGSRIKKGEAMSEVKAFIQNVHHFRDECLLDDGPVWEHVVLFDEAQRAWNKQQTCKFMHRKKNKPGFTQSEPEFLISCLDRHKDWAVIVCLVGGGQEINTGEAGIAEWIESLNRSFPSWHVYISPRLSDSEYGAGGVLGALKGRLNVEYKPELHLSVSMRSFRAENVSLLVKQLLDLNCDDARRTLEILRDRYPIVITRDQNTARDWLRSQARGTERYGVVVSSQAERLKPYAIDIKSPMDPVHWFLDGKEDVRSSYYLEDVATEFHVQGLELDWVCITWDADFRYTTTGWEHRSFRGDRWNWIKKPERKKYLKNAYRVLLTRARQGMVIVVPPGDSKDPTRHPDFYDSTFEYLESIGFTTI